MASRLGSPGQSSSVRIEQVSNHGPSDTAWNLRAALALVESRPDKQGIEEAIRQSEQSAEEVLSWTNDLATVLVGLIARAEDATVEATIAKLAGILDKRTHER